MVVEEEEQQQQQVPGQETEILAVEPGRVSGLS